MTRFDLFLILAVARWFFGFYRGWQTDTFAKMMTTDMDNLKESEKNVRIMIAIFTIIYYIALWVVAGLILPYVNIMLDKLVAE